MTGFGYDSQYNKLYEISGSWTNQVSVKSLRQCRTEQVWAEPANLDQSHRQYGFSALTTHLNQVTDEMAQHIAPTDSRFRKDIQLLEQGKFKEAESEMAKIYQKPTSSGFKPKYFKFEESQYVPTSAEDSLYWEKRIRGDWKDIEKIF